MRAATYAVATLFAVTSQSALGALVRVDFAASVQDISGQIYNYYGEPTPVSPADAEAALGGSIHVGTPFSGFFVYDDSAVPIFSDPESAGNPGGVPGQAYAFYSFPPGPGAGPYFAAHGEIGSFVGQGNSGQGNSARIEDYDNEMYIDGSHPSSIFIGAGVWDPATPEGVIAISMVELYGAGASPGAPLHGTSLHSIPWNAFPYSSAVLVFQDGDLQVSVEGALTRLVPEPAGAGLVALAACAMLATALAPRSSPPTPIGVDPSGGS